MTTLLPLLSFTVQFVARPFHLVLLYHVCHSMHTHPADGARNDNKSAESRPGLDRVATRALEEQERRREVRKHRLMSQSMEGLSSSVVDESQGHTTDGADWGGGSSSKVQGPVMTSVQEQEVFQRLDSVSFPVVHLIRAMLLDCSRLLL